MNRILITYCLAKTMFEWGNDYIDTFCPFILKVMPETKSIGTIYIQKKLRDRFAFDVPIYTLNTLIKRTIELGYISRSRNKYYLSKQGIILLNKLEDEETIERNINYLVDDVLAYIKKRANLDLSSDEVTECIISFVNKYILELTRFFQPSSQLSIPKIDRGRYKEINYHLIYYFEDAKKRKPSQYKIIESIVYGSIIASVLKSPDIREVTKEFGELDVILDSNIIFSLLDLRLPIEAKPVMELFNILKKYGMRLKVFDFTIDEIIRVLNGYEREQHSYIEGILINSVYSLMKNKGWTNEDVRLFINRISEKIRRLDIEIISTGIDIIEFCNVEGLSRYLDGLRKYKPSRPMNSYYHDLAAIEMIKIMRGNEANKREIESSKCIFLSSDLILSSFNFNRMGHKDNSTISEVIPGKLLTNILWLKYPNVVKDLPIKDIIASNSRLLVVDKFVWKHFIKNLHQLVEKEEITDKDLSILFYHHQIEYILSDVSVADINKVTPEFIIDRLAHHKEYVNINIESYSKELAKKYIKILSWVFFIITAIILILCIPIVINKWRIIEPLAWIFGIFFSLGLPALGINITLRRYRTRLEFNISSKIYKIKCTEIERFFAKLPVDIEIGSNHHQPISKG